MRRGTVIVLIFIVLAVAVVGASQFLRSQPPLEITIAVSPLADAWVRSAVDAFNASNPIVNATRRVQVKVTTVDDLNVWSDEGQRQWTDAHPTAWIPASSVSPTYATRLSFEIIEPSLAQTVLAWGGFSDRVDVLTDGGSHPLDWGEVASAAEAQTWANIPGGNSAWGSVKLALSRPNGSMSGLAVLFSGAAAFRDQPDVSGTTISSEYQQWMLPILDSVPNFSTLGASVAKTMASRGASVGEIALLPESEWLNNLSGNLANTSNPIRLSYPAYEFVFDFPLARWQGLTADENAALDALRTWLLEQHPEAYGLRPPGGTPAQTARLFASGESYGAQLTPDLAQVVQTPPRAETQRLLLWLGGSGSMIVSQVNIYPVKSCAGITLDAAKIDERGFVNDRRWLVVDEGWGFLTQREIARMALIRTAVDDRCLRLQAPETDGFELAVDQAGKRVEVSIWKSSGVGAVDQGDEAAEWLSAVLRRKVRLVRFADSYTRQVDQRYAPRESDQVGFADAYPFLVITEESLADLNSRLDEPLPMNRFRPNIVIRDADAPYAEDTWKAIRIGDVIFDIVKPCARCAITTTDQATAKRGKEPLRTLETYRAGAKGGPLFGQNAVHRSAGTIRVGEKVEVLGYRYE